MFDTNFPSRSQLQSTSNLKSNPKLEVNYNYLTEQAKKLELNEIDFNNAEYDTVKTKIEKQKVYFWIRVYLSEEINIEPGEDITIKYTFSGEQLTTKFICYSKTGNSVDSMESFVSKFDTEDNKKVLCLMVDEEKINYDSEDIPFIRKLFKIGRYFQFELLRRSDLLLTKENGDIIDYYDIEF